MTPTAPASNRQQFLLIAALAVVGWAVVSSAAMPLWSRLSELDEQSLVAQKKLIRLRELASRQAQIDHDYAAYHPFWSKASNEAAQREFLDELEQLAQADGLQINLKPRPLEQEGGIRRISVELDVEASQQALMSFLDRLFSHPSLIELERLKIASAVSDQPTLRASLLINKILINP